MDAKEYLEQIKVLELRIKIDTKQLEEIDEYLKEYKGNNLEAYQKRMQSLKDSIDNNRIKSIMWKDTILNQIMTLSKPERVEILTKCYVEGIEFKHAAESMSYDYDYVRKIHSKALSEFAQKYARQIEEYTIFSKK